MTDHPTSLHSGAEPLASNAAGPAPDLRAEWRRLASFLTRPTLPAATIESGALKVLARVFALDVIAMFVLIIAATIAVAAGVYIPETALAGIEFTPLVIMGVLIAAPVMEELLFRGWLSGRPGAVLPLVLFIAGVAGFWFVHRLSPAVGFGLLGVGLLGALVCLFALRSRPVMAWFAALFPLFFWLSASAFALIHIFNFEEGLSLILLPLVLPQFILGMLAGYVRVQIGLWAAIALHFAHNAFALSLAALSMLAGA